MFDEARSELADALRDNDAALTVSEATDAIEGGDMMSEQVIKQHAETETVDGTKFVVTTDDLDVRFEPQTGQAAETAESASEPVEAAEEAEPSPEPAREQTAAVDLQTDEERDFYNLNGVMVDVDPAQQLAGTPTGDAVMGARKLTNSHPDVPETSVPYYPADIDGINRDTEDLFYRNLGLHNPVILEGETGTGKNQLARAAASRLNLPTYRQEFGSDTSVFDVVGEKDLHDGETVYILGKAAKAAIFGGIYIADEINMASGSITAYLHPLFEDVGSRELDLRGTGRTLRDLPPGVDWDPEKHLGKFIHPDFYAVGTCNPLHYADTKEMNDALRERCTVIEHPYLAGSETDADGIETEAKLVADEIEETNEGPLADVTSVDPKQPGQKSGKTIEDVVLTAAVLRESRRDGNAISSPIGHRSVRDTVRMAGPEEEFMSFADAAMVKMKGQASLKNDKDFVKDTVEDEL